MFQRTKISAGVLLALGGLTLVAAPAGAQETNTQRVEITGSSIKRVDAEGALPVITLRREDIERSGATTVRDLVQALPSMQGFTTSGESVNGSGGGTTTASLRNLGEKYTLVLLNGRRVAPFDTGSTVNLEQLPLSAIERVEVLADGASSLYGADAIAGVVNFITKQGRTDGELELRLTKPQRKGGDGVNFSIGKGFGDLEENGYNLYAAFSYDRERRILASQRPWSRSGVRAFTGADGRSLYLWQLSLNATPPNVELVDANDETVDLYNPVLLLNGNCGAHPASFQQGDTCRFDYGATVDLVPDSERKNLFLSGSFKLPAGFRLFAETLLSDASVKAGFAPPAQPLLFEPGDTLYERYVTPTLATRGVDPADVAYGVYYMRLADAGQRRDDFRTRGRHGVLGVDGQLRGFDVSASYTHSRTDYEARNVGGYASRLKLLELVSSNAFDPFAQGTSASSSALAPAVLNAKSTDVQSQLDVVSVRGSGPVFKIQGRDAMLGVGGDYTRQRYKDFPASIYQGPNAIFPDEPDFPVGSDNGSTPFDARRNSWGAFTELVVPVLKGFEITGALRYDSYDAVENRFNFIDLNTLGAPATQGNDASKTTYKLSFRYQPTSQWLVRGSVGTGFRAPTLSNIASPLTPFGVIGTQRACPVQAGDPLFVGCRSQPFQYRQQRGGNALSGTTGLQPETSDQWAVGVRWEPNREFNVGFDFWNVRIKDAISLIPEDTAFDNFERYRSLFTVTTDPATQRPILTFNQVFVNSAERAARGIDWDMTLRNRLPFGRLTTQFSGTYLLKSYFDLGFGGGRETSLRRLGSDDQVAFRVITRLAATLDTGNWSNTLVWNWRPGYTDQSYTADDRTIRVRNPDGSPGEFVAYEGHKVSSYGALDWQGQYKMNNGLTLVAGIRNVLDKDPPFTVKTVAGNQLGADSRYHDVIGRTYYLRANYKF